MMISQTPTRTPKVRTTSSSTTQMMLLAVGVICLGSSPTTVAGFGTRFIASRQTPSTSPFVSTILYTTQNKNKNNEWGIPYPDDLPPLSDTIRTILPNGGRISLIGSGPGDPELLTLKAARMLQDPDALVVADRLVSDEILQLIRGDMKTARKLPGCADLAQDEIYQWCHEGLQQGKHVIRLKIGDPFVFGRGAEEVLQFRKYGVEPDVVPVCFVFFMMAIATTIYLILTFCCYRGCSSSIYLFETSKQGVSSAFSAPLLGSIPVTHRGVANQVVMTTGYGRDGTCPDLIKYHPEQTLVFLMAVGRLEELCENLIATAGYPKETPVGIVERAGCPNQRTVVGDMTTIATIARENNIKPPSVIVVGEVVNVLLQRDDLTGQAVTGLIQNATAVHV